MSNNAQGGWVDVPQTPAASQTTAGQGDWVDVPTTPAVGTVPPAKVASAEKAAQKATGLKAQPKMFSGQWLKEKAFQGAVGAAEYMPAIGATIGGIAGGGFGGGTTFGMGAVPGAITGAGIVGGAGEAARQLTLRALGFPSPTTPATSGQAARGIGEQAALQGALQAGGEFIPPLAAKATGFTPEFAQRLYGRALAPTTAENKMLTQEIVPQLIQQRERAGFRGLPTLHERATSELARLNPQLDAAYVATAPGTTQLSAHQIVQDLDKLKDEYLVRGKAPAPTAVSAVSKINEVQKLIQDQYIKPPTPTTPVIQGFAGAAPVPPAPHPPLTPTELRDIKQLFDEPVAKAKGFTVNDLATSYTLKAQKAAANSIRTIMAQANPDVAALNAKISFWIKVQDVTAATIERQTGQQGGLGKTLYPYFASTAAGAVLGGAGYAVHGPEGGLLAGSIPVLTQAAAQMVRSPAWRTTSAVFRSQVADAVASGNLGRLAVLGARIGLAVPAIERAEKRVTGQLSGTQQ